MPSEEALKQAGRDVLQYHSRRVYIPPTLSRVEKWILFGSIPIALGGFWLMLQYETATLGGALVLAIPLCFFAAILRGNNPTRKEVAEAALQYNKAIHLLTHSKDVEAVGPLCEILWLPDITAYVPQALRQLLPQLQPHHAALLTSKQRNSLTFILTQPDSYDRELQRATVTAMGNIGDAKALSILEQLAGGALGAADSPELREDARTAFLALQERINPGYAGRNLLRAAEAPIHSPEELLRPANGSSETPPQELLRAPNGP